MCKDWTKDQKQIYAGLKEIGGEAAGYFKSALTYYYDASLSNRVSHLAHDAREIDGGLRDIFSPMGLKKKAEKNLLTQGLEKIFGSEYKDYKGHIASILVALDVNESDLLAQEWISIATKFAKYAHRSGIWKAERPFDEFKPLWDRYEKVLFKLIGSYYAVIARIDRLINLEEITYASTGTMLNLLKNRTYSAYFFGKVKGINWFNVLKQNGIFNPSSIQRDKNGQISNWGVLPYLEHTSTLAIQYPKIGKDLIDIIHVVVQYSNNINKINDSYIWWYCVKILNNLPSNIIKDHLPVEKFRTWLSVWTHQSVGVDLAISDVAKKLLPMFLNNDYGPDYKYAEIIIDVITEIRAGDKPFLTIGREDAVMAWEPYWIKDALKKSNQLIAEKCSPEIILCLADKLKNALEYRQSDSSANIEIGNNVYQIYVSKIKKEGLKDREIGYKDDLYECSVKQFSQEQIKDIDIKNDYWTLHNIGPKIEILKPFTFVALDNNAMASAIKQNLPTEIDWKSADKFEKNLRYFYTNLHSDFLQIWIKSLAVGGGDHFNSAENVLTIIIRDILLGKCEAKRDEGKQILDAFLGDKYKFPIFKRFVLLCIDKFWDDYSGYMDKICETNSEILKEPDFEVEMQDILKHHNSAFSLVIKSKLKELINNVPEYYIEEGEKSIAYWKFKWLSPLCDNPDFKDEFEEARKNAGIKEGETYKTERSAIRGGIVVHNTPITKDEILKKPILELLKILSEFKGASSLHSTLEGEPDREGLADTLQSAIKDNPKKFTDEIDAFHKADYFYIHSILRGFKEAWNSNKDIDWEKIFGFSVSYFERDKETIMNEAIIGQGEDSGKGKYIWIVEDIVDLIEDGCNKDNRAFGEEHFKAVEKIFDLVLPIPIGEKQPDTQRDALTYALNTTIGRIIRSYISFSLHVARVTKKREEKWGKNTYERFFDKGIEADIWFGGYLPQMNYLDTKYAEEKIVSFGKKDSTDFNWKMFMEGYLTMSQVYKDVYHLMRQNYLNALNSKASDKRVNQRLVQHVCIGYLNFNELLQPKNKDNNDSLFWKMLTNSENQGKSDRWLEVSRFFWSLTGQKVSDDSKKKILDFWRWTFNNPDIVKTNTGDNYNSFLGSMTDLTILLDEIDEEKEKWLLLCAPHIDRHHHSSFFIESLKRFDGKENMERIGRIFKKILENTTPTFPQDDIVIIVRRIYEKGNRKDADDICNTYGRQGIHFLKPLWDEFQVKSHT